MKQVLKQVADVNSLRKLTEMKGGRMQVYYFLLRINPQYSTPSSKETEYDP